MQMISYQTHLTPRLRVCEPESCNVQRHQIIWMLLMSLQRQKTLELLI